MSDGVTKVNIEIESPYGDSHAREIMNDLRERMEEDYGVYSIVENEYYPPDKVMSWYKLRVKEKKNDS